MGGLMKFVICRHGETRSGKATVTLERGATTLVVKGVPARVSASCGEEYVDEAIAAQLLKTAEEAGRSGVQIDVRGYAAATASRWPATPTSSGWSMSSTPQAVWPPILGGWPTGPRWRDPPTNPTKAKLQGLHRYRIEPE